MLDIPILTVYMLFMQNKGGGGSHPHKFNEWGYKPFSLMKVHQRFIDETL